MVMAHQGQKVFEIAIEIRTRIVNNIFILYQILKSRTHCLKLNMIEEKKRASENETKFDSCSI